MLMRTRVLIPNPKKGRRRQRRLERHCCLLAMTSHRFRLTSNEDSLDPQNLRFLVIVTRYCTRRRPAIPVVFSAEHVNHRTSYVYTTYGCSTTCLLASADQRLNAGIHFTIVESTFPGTLPSLERKGNFILRVGDMDTCSIYSICANSIASDDAHT